MDSPKNLNLAFTMRKRFDNQLKLGQIPIDKVKIPEKSRDELPPVLKGLQWLHSEHKLLNSILGLIEEKLDCDLNNGRPGMALWHILVLGVIRLTVDADYDRLEHIANYDTLVRQIMGVEYAFAKRKKEFGRQTLIDNIHLFDAKLLWEINQLILQESQTKVFLKKKEEGIQAKTDSYVLETNVHFPTDWNLLYDAGRKSIELVSRACNREGIKGWRKSDCWIASLKRLMRQFSQVNRSGGSGKQERTEQAARKYLNKAKELQSKIQQSMQALEGKLGEKEEKEIIYFAQHLQTHILLFERRVLKGEKIPHDDKIFSLFENYTQWINKGKASGPELGVKVLVTSDENNLIVDYKMMEDNVVDFKEASELSWRLKTNYGKVESLSGDKAFHEKETLKAVSKNVDLVVIPKKGKRNKEEESRESEPEFKKLRKQHSAIESTINCLEHHGLDRCPDKGIEGFERYLGLGMLAYNLHLTGRRILEKEKQKREKERRKAA